MTRISVAGFPCGLAAFAITLFLTACGAQSAHSVAPPPIASDTSGTWYLLLPPQRPYSTDRTPAMGGPLASPPLEGREMHGTVDVYSLEEVDTDAPLKRWRRLGEFRSERDCEAAKAGQAMQYNDPASIAKLAERRRDRLTVPSYVRDWVKAERCVNASQIPQS